LPRAHIRGALTCRYLLYFVYSSRIIAAGFAPAARAAG
jgi:hypothetical protein